jgi:P4 family phage/plasmid primase-like protien
MQNLITGGMQMFIELNVDGIPSELKDLPHWILWSKSEDKSSGRFGKKPINKRGYPVDATDPKNWLTFKAALSERERSSHAAGLGLCMSGNPVTTHEGPRFLVGIDIDECVRWEDAGAGGLTEQAAEILGAMNSYSEISPSGTGVRGFFYADYLPTSRNSNGKEIYATGRFLTVTGEGVGQLRLLSRHEIEHLMALMFNEHPLRARAPTNSKPPPRETPDAILKMKDALGAIPAGISRDQWMRVVLSVKAHGFSCGEESARRWSESAGHYDPETNRNGYDEKAFNDVWRCDPRATTQATLYFFAKNYSNAANSVSYGDTFNGQVFAELHRGALKFVYPAGKWIRWTGTHWEWCKSNEPLEAAKQAAREILDRATKDFQCEPSSAEAKRKLAHAQQSFNLKRLESMQICAAAESAMYIGEIGELDADPMMLGCLNGVVDLRTGHLVPPLPEYLITKQVCAEYSEDEPCVGWEQFLRQVMLEDDESIEYLQRAVGYTLTGKVNEEVLHFAYGGGRNGKSVFANILRRLFNDYAVVAPAEMLMQRDRGSGANNDVARLVGARLLLANETRNGQALDDLALKTLVSTEAISARFLHKEYFEFQPTHKIWMRGNHKPLLRDETEGAWRRIRLLPFELDLRPEDVDQCLEEKLWAERDGILAWAVRGCLAWQRDGLHPPPRVLTASANYRQDCDLFGEFIEEHCVLDRSAKVGQRVLWETYRRWCEDNGVRIGSKKAFTRKLTERGVTPTGWLGKERLYTGIRERTERDNTAGLPTSLHMITGSEGVPTFSPIKNSPIEETGNTPSSCEVVVRRGEK